MGSRTGEMFGPVNLFPNSDVSSGDYYDHAPRKTLAPVATKPYDDGYKHGSPTKSYPSGYDDEWHRQTNPVHAHSRPHGGDEFLAKRKMIPVATGPYGGYEYPNSSPKNPYQAGGDDEWYRQHKDDELLIKRGGVPVPVTSRPFGADEYGHGSPKKANPARDYGKSHEVLTKRTVVPVPVTSRPFGADEYGHGSPKKANPARDYSKSHEVLTKRTVVPVGTRPNGLEYERSSPAARTDPARHDTDDKWHGTEKAQASQPVIWTEWRRPQRSYNGNEEEPKAIDIDKVAEMLIQNARLAHASEGEYKEPKPSAKNPFPIPNYDSRERRNLGVDRPTPSSPTSDGLGIPIDARRRSATIDCWEAERKYSGQRV